MKKDNIPKVPGPADYNVSIPSKAPKYGFPKDHRENKGHTSGPGPADYHIPCSIRDVPEFVRKKGNFLKEYTFI